MLIWFLVLCFINDFHDKLKSNDKRSSNKTLWPQILKWYFILRYTDIHYYNTFFLIFSKFLRIPFILLNNQMFEEQFQGEE
jgi:hypothetical protein